MTDKNQDKSKAENKKAADKISRKRLAQEERRKPVPKQTQRGKEHE